MLVRARRFEPRASHLVDRAGEPIATARLASIGDHVLGLDRLVALGGPALRQAAHPWIAAHGTEAALPVVVAATESTRPGLDARLAGELVPRLAANAGVSLDAARSSVVLGGRAGGVDAVERAIARLDAGAPAVLVGGVDSWFDPDALEALDADLRLHGRATENGFVPGEGAGFALLVRPDARAPSAPLARVITAATDDEPAPFGSADPCLAAGLTRAASRAVSPLGARAGRVGWALTDVVDERHRVDEWAFVAARIARALARDAVHDQPALVTGDLGAATVGVAIAIAATRWATACAPSDVALLSASSDGPRRGAIVLAAA